MVKLWNSLVMWRSVGRMRFACVSGPRDTNQRRSHHRCGDSQLVYAVPGAWSLHRYDRRTSYTD